MNVPSASKVEVDLEKRNDATLGSRAITPGKVVVSEPETSAVVNTCRSMLQSGVRVSTSPFRVVSWCSRRSVSK